MPAALPDPVTTLVDAANRGDRQGFLDAFTSDGVVDDWGREFRGAEAIGGWSDGEFVGVQVVLEVVDVRVEDDGAVTVTARVGGNGFNGPSHFTFHVAGDAVSRMTIRA